ncbi:MAG: phenylalanine--tRNA ligase subunit alpha [Candidatus Woesearchaeota archaeon]
MDTENLISKLHPLERKVLPVLKTEKELSAIVNASGLQEIEVMRALQWLENKNVLKIFSESKKVVALDKNGIKYQKEGLPEKKFLQSLTNKFQPLSIIAKNTSLEKEEIDACIGLLKRKVAIDIQKDQELMIKLGSQGDKILKEGTFEEKLLLKHFPLDFNDLSDIDKFALEELKKRKEFVKTEDRKTVTIELSELGQKLISMKIDAEVVNRLTPNMLKTGSWKNKQFRAYDIEVNVPQTYYGKKHFVNQAIEYAKKVWMDMGFEEMTGNMVNTSFWNFDALFTAQDHPVREMQDTYYLGGKVEKGTLPEAVLIKRVKAVHENGGNTGSRGWRYAWNEEEAKKNVLRTHTTVLTSQTLSKLKEKDLPKKYFALGKCYRNEALDWCHHFEFNQTEGIVIDENANFSHLLGYLREFFKKMGFPQARFRPAFFPYTEPSVEIDVWHPVHKTWIELGGAGMMRPEVIVPLLGKDIPVLAWGPGFDRIILDYYQIKDIRDLYKNDLKLSREAKAWLK